MIPPAFTLVAPRRTFDARSLLERLANPEWQRKGEFWVIYAIICAEAHWLDGADREQAFDHLIAVCSVFVDHATDLQRDLKKWQRKPDFQYNDEGYDYDDAFDGEDGDPEKEEVLHLSDFELEARGQLLLPFAGVSEHYQSLAVMSHEPWRGRRRLALPTAPLFHPIPRMAWPDSPSPARPIT